MAAEENLTQVIAFELDRQTPFRADQVRYDFRIVKRDPVAKLLHVDADTVATLTSVMQSIALEVMGALLWTVALPRSTKKTKVQEVKIKHVVPYNIPKPPQLLGWARTMLIQHQGQPRDSPVRR